MSSFPARLTWCRNERKARDAIGMPLCHLERITRDLPQRQEAQLAALAEELWPDEEYAAIITASRPDDRPDGGPESMT